MTDGNDYRNGVINVQDLRLTEGLVSIINQKFEYLKKVSDQELFLEIIPLYNFLLSTPQVLGIIQKSNIELQNEINHFNILEKEVQQEIKAKGYLCFKVSRFRRSRL